LSNSLTLSRHRPPNVVSEYKQSISALNSDQQAYKCRRAAMWWCAVEQKTTKQTSDRPHWPRSASALFVGTEDNVLISSVLREFCRPTAIVLRAWTYDVLYCIVFICTKPHRHFACKQWNINSEWYVNIQAIIAKTLTYVCNKTVIKRIKNLLSCKYTDFF